MVSPMTCFAASSTNGMAQPPWVNPLLGSSSGPPGACMTPSSVTWVMAMIFLIGSLPFLRVEAAGLQVRAHLNWLFLPHERFATALEQELHAFPGRTQSSQST